MEAELGVRKAIVFLAFLLFSASERIQKDVADKSSRVKHLFVQRDKPLPGSPKKLYKIEHEEPSRSSGGHNVHELFGRFRRSLNPDMKPPATVLQAHSVDEFSAPQYAWIPKLPQQPTGRAPDDLKATPYNTTAIKLTWQPAEDGPSGQIIYYIYYGTLTSGVSSRSVGHTAAKTFVVGHLQQDIVYVFEVSAGLTGRHSEAVNSKTKFDADNEPVHSLKAVVVNSSSIVLTWTKPEGVSLSSIQNYQVKQSFKDKYGGIATVTKNTKGKETTYTFKYLHFNTNYTFEVRTRLVKGDLGKNVSIIKRTGPFSASVGPLRKNIQDNTVILSWSEPWTIDLKKDLKFYNISWTCLRCYQRSGLKVLLKDTTCQVPNLQRDKTYNFYVHAITTYGPGEESTTTATISRYFGQVRNLRQAINNYTVTLQWIKPSDVDAKDIKRYLVSWCDTTTSRYCYRLNSTNVTGTQFTKRLFAGDTYTFYVRAVTAYGEGKESSIQVFVPPLNLQVSYIRGHTTGRYGLQIHLYWYLWSIPYGQDVQYEVRWHCIRGRGSCYWSQWSSWNMQTVNKTSVTLNMTRYDTAYLFEVRVVTPQGRGRPTQYYLSTNALSGIPANFTCKVTPSNTYLVCHWSPPTDFNPAGFYHYHLKYRCDDCLYNPVRYKTIYGFNQTSVNVTVNSGARYTAWISVHTRYGVGKQAQTTTATKPPLGPVTMLKATLDDKIQNLVNLTWNPPSSSSPILYYVVITQCPACSSFEPIRTRVHNTSFSQNLPCGNEYIFTVRAVTNTETSTGSQVTLSIEPTIGPVTNLTVKFIPGNGSTDWIKRERDRFLLTWDPPKVVPHASIEFYEITVMTANKHQYVSVSRTKATYLLIKCADLVSGKYYIFQSRCKALCGFGPNNSAFGFYPAFPSPSTQLQSSVATSLLIAPTSSLSSLPVMFSTIPEKTIAMPTSPTKPSPANPSATRSSPTKSSPTKPPASRSSPTMPSPTKLFSSLPQIDNKRHHQFPYWTIPTAILGVILVIIVVLFVCKNYRWGKRRRFVENYFQDFTKDSPEEEDMPFLLESLTDDEMPITA